ncbi:hypothetical protein ABLE91_13015 [Aquabacter sp. CN5-332]|uniref:hypothetical protein n=1 Tax=Aquabacter sp. CN5-332 TaxID=3156608 RepID=UPI0032B5D00C
MVLVSGLGAAIKGGRRNAQAKTQENGQGSKLQAGSESLNARAVREEEPGL